MPILRWVAFALFGVPAAAGPLVVGLSRRPRRDGGPGGNGGGRADRADRDRRRLAEEADEAWLYGDVHVLMAYHVDVLVGTPGQMQSVIVDTGSSTTAFPCTSCGSNCGSHLDEPFDPDASSSFRWVGCGERNCHRCTSNLCSYGVSYVEGSSIRGTFFEDVLHLGHGSRGNREHPVRLGCHSEETNLFKTQVPSGIMGLGEGGWDVIEALAEGPLEREVFGLCFGSQGGAMTLGFVNETWTPLLEPLQWVPYSAGYHVPVNKIDVVDTTGVSTAVSSLGNFMVDSGTTYTYFTTAQANSLYSAIETACAAGACGGASKTGSWCWNAEGDAIDTFPALYFSLGSGSPVMYMWPARDGYLIEKSTGRWCYTFYGEPPLTLGASFIKHHLWVFDRADRRLGFARSSCPTISSRSENGKPPAGNAADTGNLTAIDLRQVGGTETESAAAVRISVGSDHSCGLRADTGVAICWGSDDHSQLSGAPADVPLTAIALGYDHACGLRVDTGATVCWGSDVDNQVSGAPAGVVLGAIAAAGYYTCGIRADTGEATCWGWNGDNQVSGAPVGVVLTKISANVDHACGLRADTWVATCWGYNGHNQVSGAPVGVKLADIAAGFHHSCGLTAYTRVATCWGRDNYNQVSGAPAGIPMTAITAGHNHNCGLRASTGVAICWGFDDHNQVSGVPAGVQLLAIASLYHHNCGIRADTGMATCWGLDDDKQVSDAPASLPLTQASPAPSPAPSPAADVSGGGSSPGSKTDGTSRLSPLYALGFAPFFLQAC